MKLIIFGANGMLGNYLAEHLKRKYHVVRITRDDIDIANTSNTAILKFLRKRVKVDDLIINACGLIPQRNNASIADMYNVNTWFPKILAEFKSESGCQVIHITTDCVFSGSKGNYIETDIHDAKDEYGKTKSEGEHPALTNIRTSIIGEEIRNKKSLLEWVISNKNKTIDGYVNHIWNGVTCLELAKYIESCIDKRELWRGTRHIFSPEPITKYDLVKMISDIYNLNITVNEKATIINCDKTLNTIFDREITKPLYEQIVEMKNFKL